ncbi:leucine-rich repeat and immunoglobulin-like domain-containing nogo receptor-interacting protein 2 [Engraulis encrasicolus]|uniref:leucine-rich repeat and immunoglobulin-like domain-containing nogo receptor-interacting protein 2 n=1 Tax=Engraulis encrasicolus TaxID=184585 RepID=UPI002FD2E540
MCSIHVIDDSTFANLVQLKELDLSFNRISVISTNTFKGLKHLDTLIITDNPLKHLEQFSFSHLRSLKTLHLGHLMLSSLEQPWHSGMQLLNLTSIFVGFPRHLSDFKLTSGLLPMTLVIADDSTPEMGLSLSLTGENIVLWGCERPFLRSVTKLYIASQTVLCSPDLRVPLQYFTSVVHLEFLQWYTNTFQDLSGLNRLAHLNRLELSNVDLYNQPGLPVMFHGLANLENLSLYNCLISSFESSVTVNMKSLKFLYLWIPPSTTLTKLDLELLKCLRSALVQ